MTKQEAIAEKEKLQQRIAELDNVIYNGFPIGTKVKIIDWLHGHGFEIGEEVEIVECENTDFLAENIRGDRWYIQTSEFVPIEYDDKCYQEDKELLNILIEANKQLK